MDSNSASPDKSAIARAIEARMKQSSDPNDETNNQALVERRQRETRLIFAKIVDTKIRRENNYQEAAKCLQHLTTLISNISQNPTDPKYKSIKPSNPTLSRELFPIVGAREFLMEIGFRLKRADFKEAWILADGNDLSKIGLERVNLAKEVLEEKIKVTETLAERETRMKKEEAEFEKGRKARALEEYQQDRERKAQRDSVARRARASAAANAIEESTYTSNLTPSLNLHDDNTSSSSSSNNDKRTRGDFNSNQNSNASIIGNGGNGSGKRLGGDQITLTGDDVHTNQLEESQFQNDHQNDDDDDEDEDEDDGDEEEDDDDEEIKPKKKNWGGGQRLGGE